MGESSGILVDRVRGVIEGMTGNEQEDFKSGRGGMNLIFPMKLLNENTLEKNQR